MLSEATTDVTAQSPDGESDSAQPDAGSSNDGGRGGRHDHGGRYWRFAAMIATSMAAMFALTYVNTYRLADVKWSETRFYMTFVMGAAMAVIMLGFMVGMYQSRKTNAAIVAGSVLVFALALWLVRSQETVQDESLTPG